MTHPVFTERFGSRTLLRYSSETTKRSLPCGATDPPIRTRRSQPVGDRGRPPSDTCFELHEHGGAPSHAGSIA